MCSLITLISLQPAPSLVEHCEGAANWRTYGVATYSYYVIRATRIAAAALCYGFLEPLPATQQAQNAQAFT